jgi:type II secretory pathway component PulC
MTQIKESLTQQQQPHSSMHIQCVCSIVDQILRNLLQRIFTQITTHPIQKKKKVAIVVMNLHRSCFHGHKLMTTSLR